MKKINLAPQILIVGGVLLGICQKNKAQNVGINPTGAAPDSSAVLDVSASDKGLLIPRVLLTGTTDVTTITSPATSLLVYNTATVADVTPGFYYFTGTNWERIVSGMVTGTDEQNISGSSLNGTALTIGIENGSSETVDLSSLKDGAGTDDQNISGSGLDGTTLTIGIENGNNETVDLSSLRDGTGTDDQNISGSGLNGTTLTIGIENGTNETVDLSSLRDGSGTDDQNISGSGLNGTTLTIGIENGTNETVDLSSLRDGTGTDNQTLNLTGNTLSIVRGNSITLTDNVNDADADSTNEIQRLSITGNVISLSDGGSSVSIPSSADNLGNHTATQNIDLATKKLVGNGGSLGVLIKNDGETRVENLPDYNPLTDNLYVVANSSGELHRVSILDLAAQIKLINEYPTGTVFCTPVPTAIVDVVNPTTGKTWMDRNLGASQVATSRTDVNAYGDLYQWGRLADGHQCRTSNTTNALSANDIPGNDNMIISSGSPYDWRVPQNHNLWQGVNGINNPCPNGYRLPTNAELHSEYQSWSSDDRAGAFSSPLKLPTAGCRLRSNGSLSLVGSYGFYWSSTVISGIFSRYLRITDTHVNMHENSRASLFSVRCIKD